MASVSFRSSAASHASKAAPTCSRGRVRGARRRRRVLVVARAWRCSIEAAPTIFCGGAREQSDSEVFLRRCARARRLRRVLSMACAGTGRARWLRRVAMAAGQEHERREYAANALGVSERGRGWARAAAEPGRCGLSRRGDNRNHRFLPNGDFVVSWCVGARVDVVSPRRNGFF